MATLTLIGRTYCHLCDDMRLAAEPLLEEFGVDLLWVDADADPELEVRYGERVPVLLHGETELCHYFMDVAKVRDYLSKIG